MWFATCIGRSATFSTKDCLETYSFQISFLTQGIKAINSGAFTENIKSLWCAENETKGCRHLYLWRVFLNSHWQSVPHAPKLEAFVHVEVNCSQRKQFSHAQTNPELGQPVSLGGRVSGELCLGHCLIPVSQHLRAPAPWASLAAVMLCTE